MNDFKVIVVVSLGLIIALFITVVSQLYRIEVKLTPAAVQQPAPAPKPGFTLQFSGSHR